MNASQIARRQFEIAIAEGRQQSIAPDTIARSMLSLAIETFLASRTPADVKQELAAAAENVDPDADFVFMRP